MKRKKKQDITAEIAIAVGYLHDVASRAKLDMVLCLRIDSPKDPRLKFFLSHTEGDGKWGGFGNDEQMSAMINAWLIRHRFNARTERPRASEDR